MAYKTLRELISHHETPILKKSLYTISANIQTDYKVC